WILRTWSRSIAAESFRSRQRIFAERQRIGSARAANLIRLSRYRSNLPFAITTPDGGSPRPPRASSFSLIRATPRFRFRRRESIAFLKRASVSFSGSCARNRMGDGRSRPRCRFRPRARSLCGPARQVLPDADADDFLEPLAVRFDRARRLIEEHALDAKQRSDHRDKVEVRLLPFRQLPQPIVKRVEIDAAKCDARRRQSGENAEKFLLRVHQVHDDERRGIEAFDHSHCNPERSEDG